jgi:acyl-CoA dehydrogenase
MYDYSESDLERMIRTSVRETMEPFDEDYWREIRNEDARPTDAWEKLAENNWTGVSIPEAYGGQGLGVQGMTTVMEEIARAGGWSMAFWFVNSAGFGGEALERHGSDRLKEKWLPRLAEGEAKWALGVTEPDAGLNTLNISTRAEKEGDEYVIDGQKTFITGVSRADRITLLARTLPASDADSRAHGFSVFVVDPDDENVDYEEIPLDIFWENPVYNVYLDDVRVHESQLLGEPHQGFYHILDVLNAERVQVATLVTGIGFYALDRAAEYANQREVFDAPIGSHQAIQHPLAEAYAKLQCARLMIQKAAWQYDNDVEQSAVGGSANIAMHQGIEGAWKACDAAMTTFGGMSATRGIGIAKAWEVVRHLRIAPISEQMVRNYIAEHELGLPKSY